jgi:hypothetical protein
MRQISVHSVRLAWQGHYLLNNGTIGANPNGAQCVNVSNSAAQLLGLRASFGSARNLSYPGAEWVANSPDNVPPHGAIVLFNPVAPYDLVSGHTGMVLNDSTVDKLHILWQDFPYGAPVEGVWTSYAECAGWWVLKSPTAEWRY